jgi:hypothetical protein
VLRCPDCGAGKLGAVIDHSQGGVAMRSRSSAFDVEDDEQVLISREAQEAFLRGTW